MLLTSWLCGWSGRARSDQNEWHAVRRRLRRHELRRSLALTIEPLEIRLVPTTISLDGADLTIDSTGSVNNFVQVRFDNTNDQFVVEDPNETLNVNGTISGATGSGTNSVVIPRTSVINAQRVLVRMFDGDDRIELSPASDTFPIAIAFDGGIGQDMIRVNAAVTSVVTGVAVSLVGEDTSVQGNITTDQGNVFVQGDNVLLGSAITTAFGDVIVTGFANVSGNIDTDGGQITFNSGVTIQNPLTTDGGPLTFHSNAVILADVSTGSGDIILNGFTFLSGNVTTGGGNFSANSALEVGADVTILTNHPTETDGSISFIGQLDSAPGSSTYTLINTARSYDEARQQAKDDVPGGYLATIRSSAEQALALSAIGSTDAWLSASDADVEGEWRWKDGPDFGVQFWAGDETGSPVSLEYNNWFSGEPDNNNDLTEQDAAFLNGSDGFWRDDDVNFQRAYLVEAPTLFGLVIDAGDGSVTFNGSIGNFLPLKSLAISASLATLGVGSIKTNGSQVYNSDLSLLGPTFFHASEVDFNGGAGSVVPLSVSMPVSLHVAPVKSDADINIGGTSDNLNSFDITDTDISALGAGFSNVLIGQPPPPPPGGLGGLEGQPILPASTGPVAITGATFLSSLTVTGGSIVVSDLNVGTNFLELIAINGSINDDGGTGPDIIAGNVALDSRTGVGTSSPLDTAISGIAARSQMDGGVFVNNTGSLQIGAPGAQGGIYTNAAPIEVTSTDAITVNLPIVSTGGDVSLTAANGITLNGTFVDTTGLDISGSFISDADSDDDGVGNFNVTTFTDFVDWTSSTEGVLPDGTTVTIARDTFGSPAEANPHTTGGDTRFNTGSIYSPLQAAGDFVETKFASVGQVVTFRFSSPQFGVFLHLDGVQFEDAGTFPGASEEVPLDLYSFTAVPEMANAFKGSGEPGWQVNGGVLQQTSGGAAADLDGTVRFSFGVERLTLTRLADGVSTGAENVVSLQLGVFHGGGVKTGSNTITIHAADVQLNGFLDAGSQTVTFLTSGTSRPINLGSNTAGSLSLTDAELDQVAAGTIQVGDADSGSITISNNITRPEATDLSLTTGGNHGIEFTGTSGVLDSNNGNVVLTLNPTGTGAITSGGALKDIRGINVSLLSGSDGIGTDANPFITDASSLAATTNGNASMFLQEIDSVTLDATGLSAGTGTVTLKGGTFRLGSSDRIDSNSKLDVKSAATFELNGFNETVNSLTGTGRIVNRSASESTLTVDLATTEHFPGVLGGPGTDENNFRLNKTGTGALILSETSTYTGLTTVSAGRLVVNGSIASDVTVANGADLAGSGSVGLGHTITVQSGGEIAPGTSPEVLDTGNVVFESGSTFNVELDGTTPGPNPGGHDQLNVTGTVSIATNVTLLTTLGYTPAAGDTLVLINNDGADTISGTFNGLPQGTLLTLGTAKFHIVYNHNSGDGNLNDVALIANRLPVISGQTFSISEADDVGAVVGTVAANDADSAVTFAITGEDTSNVFAIGATTGQLTVNDVTRLNFETEPTFALTVQVTDDAGASTTATVTISVTNAPPGAPEDADAAANSVSEGAANDSTVGIDADSDDVHGGAVTFQLTNDAGGRFTIDSNSGVVSVANAGLLNFETTTTHTIVVEASDGVAATTQTFSIGVTNVAPLVPIDADAAANEVSEGANNGDLVGIDANSGDVHGGGVIFSLTDDANGRFAIHPSTGIVRVADASQLNFESAVSHLIVVQASDGTDVTTATFTIAVTNVAPTSPFDVDNALNSVTQGMLAGDSVGIDVNSQDRNGGSVTFALTDDASGLFEINADTGVVSIVDPTSFSFDVTTTFSIIVEASDGTATNTKSFNILLVGASPTLPIDIDEHVDSIPEGALDDSRVGVRLRSIDPQDESVFYRLTDDADGRFKVDPISGVVTVKEGHRLVFANATQHTLRAVAVDELGNESAEFSFVVSVTQVPVDALPLVSILPTRVDIVERDFGPLFITFLVKLNKPSAEVTTVDFTTRTGDERGFEPPEALGDDVAFATDIPGPWDFFRSSGKITFDPGVTEQPLRVQIRPDNVPEPNEFFFVQLLAPDKLELAPQQSVAAAQLLDDDSVPQLIVEDAQRLEGDSAGQNELVFTVRLIGDLPPGVSEATADFSTGNIAIDTALPADDYTVTAGTLTFSNAERERVIRIPIVGNLTDDADKTVSLRFTNPVNLAISRREVTGTIINDDSPAAEFVLSPKLTKVRETNSGSQQIELVVTLIGKPSSDVAVNYATADETALAGSDYSATGGTIDFTLSDIASGNIQRSIFVTYSGDTDVELDESLLVSLSLPATPPPNVSINPDRGTSRIVLRNDDQAILTEDGDALALALSGELTALLGGGSKNNPALIRVMQERALEIIRTQGLTKAIVIIIDPVDFVLTDTQNRQAGYSANTGVVNQIPGSYYSGDGDVELLVVPLPPDGTYNLQLAGLGGEFNTSVTILDANGTSTSILSQQLADGSTSSFAFEVGGDRTIPVGLGLAAANSAAVSTVGVVGAFGQADLRLALAAAFEQATNNEFNVEDDANAPTGLMFWLSVSARIARQQFLEPLLQSLGSPLEGLLGETLLVTPSTIPAELVDQFWSQVGQTLTGVPSGVYRLGNMLESLLPTLLPRRNRPAPPRAGEQGQPNPAPNNGVRTRRTSFERPRQTPTTTPGGSSQSAPQNKSNAPKPKSADAADAARNENQQSSTPETRWLWFTFKESKPSAKSTNQQT